MVLFNVECGLFSPAFAKAMHYSDDPDTLTSALRAPIGRLLPDGRFDVWWMIDSGGSVHRRAGGQLTPVDSETDSELKECIARVVVPMSRQNATVESLSERFFDLARSMQTGLADAAATLALVEGRDVGALPLKTTAAALVDEDEPTLPVHVEKEEGGGVVLVTFDDEVAHFRGDIVERCLQYCQAFPGVSRAVWEDREVLRLVATDTGIDIMRLQLDLLGMIGSMFRNPEM
jgi:hypothetical protein